MKSILITGCSSGIGRDCALTLHAQGWQVFASCRKAEDCAELQKMGIDSPQLDHANTQSITDVIAYVLGQTGGTLDAVYINGAFAVPGAVEDLPTDALRDLFETNFFGYHEIMRQIIPAMRAQGYGRIINCSSVLGFAAMKWRGAYNSSKFALEGLSDTLRIEMRGTGIDVILIEPGPIDTDIRANSIPHFEKWIDTQTSARKNLYKALKQRLYAEAGTDRFELPPSAVTVKIIHALNSARPKPRYYVTKPTYLMGFLRRILSTRALDWVLSRV